MEYAELARTYDALEKTSKRLKKTFIISSILKDTKESDLEPVLLMLQGRIFPETDEREIGVAAKLMIKAISTSTGYSSNDIEVLWRDTGDLGLVAERLVKGRRQNTLFNEDLTVKEVFTNLRKLSSIEGTGSVDQKVKIISKLISAAKPLEARYIVRSALQDLRVGVAHGTLRDAIAWAYFDEAKPRYDEKSESIDPENREEYNSCITLIQEGLDRTNSFVEVSAAAKKGLAALRKISLRVGQPLKVMLAQRAPSIKEAFEIVGKPAALEYKYDGFRMQVHKEKDNVVIFTRRLDDVTAQFPEVKGYVLKNVKAESCILDCEAAGYDAKSGRYTPFQSISQRIKRKYDIEKLSEGFPVELNVFDIIYFNGENQLDKPFRERRALIERIVKEEKKRIVWARQIITDDEGKAKKFFEESVKLGNEGLMFKNLSAVYKPGSRVGYMIKYKSIMDEMDLVIIGAEWGEGKRSGWLTSFIVACLSDDGFLEMGRVGTGLKEKKEEGLSFMELTDLLKPLIVSEKGKEITVKPKVVITLKFEEIQKSPSYSSGYALRFPRVTALREDRSTEDIATLEEVEEAFFNQRKKSR